MQNWGILQGFRHLFFSGTLSFLALLFTGCDSNDFPQYSGVYYLQSAEYFDSQGKEDITIKGLEPPAELLLKHRMSWAGNYWDHRVFIKAHNPISTEAEGAFTADLLELLYKGSGCGPRGECDFDGTNFRSRKGNRDQAESFCTFYGYDYKIFAQVTPDPNLLNNIYWSHDPLPKGTKMPPILGASEQGPLMLTDPEKATVDKKYSEIWKNSVIQNGGISITFRVSKESNSQYFGCTEYFPLSDRDTDTGTAVFKYFIPSDKIDMHYDLRREEGLDPESLGSAPNLINQMVNFE